METKGKCWFLEDAEVPGPAPRKLVIMINISLISFFYLSLLPGSMLNIPYDSFLVSSGYLSGDLVDGRAKAELGSDQFEEEWQIYQTVLKKSKVMEKTKWIDIKGNHGETDVDWRVVMPSGSFKLGLTIQ